MPTFASANSIWLTFDDGKFMMLIDYSNLLPLLGVVQEAYPDKARAWLLQIAEFNALDDQAIHDGLEDLIWDAAIANEPTVQLDIDVAIAVLVVLKQGVRRPRGGQKKSRNDALRKKTLGHLARRLKERYVARGETATQASLKAPAVVARYSRIRGIVFAESTIKREMDNAS